MWLDVVQHPVLYRKDNGARVAIRAKPRGLLLAPSQLTHFTWDMPLRVNRAPVLTLWAAVVAGRLGHPADTALTLGRAVAGSAARVKARSIGREETQADRSADTRLRQEHVTAPVFLLGDPAAAERRRRIVCRRWRPAERSRGSRTVSREGVRRSPG
jgi:hypothetical protein